MQPSNEAELCNAVATAIAIDDQPSCFRFPRGNGIGVDFKEYGVAPEPQGHSVGGAWALIPALLCLTLDTLYVGCVLLPATLQ